MGGWRIDTIKHTVCKFLVDLLPFEIVGMILLISCGSYGFHMGYENGFDEGMVDGGPDGVINTEEYKMALVEQQNLKLALETANKTYVAGYIDGLKKGVDVMNND